MNAEKLINLKQFKEVANELGGIGGYTKNAGRAKVFIFGDLSIEIKMRSIKRNAVDFSAFSSECLKEKLSTLLWKKFDGRYFVLFVVYYGNEGRNAKIFANVYRFFEYDESDDSTGGEGLVKSFSYMNSEGKFRLLKY